MALSGTLGDFGIADIFQLIGQQQKTGVLHLNGKEEEVHISFKDGNVVKAESAARKRKELLGHMLVRARLISDQQLEAALDEQKRTLRRLGDILVSSNTIGRDALKEMTHLQTTETLYRLFAWKQGSYAFEQQDVDVDPESVTPIRSESVLMEGFRRVDEWPAVRKVITSGRMTFERLKEAPAESASDDDFGLDAAFGEAPDDEPKKGELGRAERKVLGLWEAGRTVSQFIDLSRLGEFETCKALSVLVSDGYLEAIAPARKDDDDALGSGAQKPLLERLREAAGSAAVTILLVAAVVFVCGQSGLFSQRLTRGEVNLVDPAAQRLLGQGQLERIRGALAIYELEHGEVPTSLDALATERILPAAELQYPWGERYYYRRSAAHAYVLLPPLR